MAEETSTLSVDAGLKKQFDAKALEAGCDRDQVIRDFMVDYVNREPVDRAAYESWLRAEVQIGIDEADAGELISNDEVEAESIAWREQLRGKVADPAK
jgi:predicted transcriptional regulator